MMKKNRIIAVLVSLSYALSMSSGLYQISAEEYEGEKGNVWRGTLYNFSTDKNLAEGYKQIIEKYDEDTIIYRSEKRDYDSGSPCENVRDYTLVVTPDGIRSEIYKCETVDIMFRDDVEIPEEEIKKLVEKYAHHIYLPSDRVEETDHRKIYVSLNNCSNESEKNTLLEELMKLDQISTMSIRYQITDGAYVASLNAAIESDKTAEELINEYSALGLSFDSYSEKRNEIIKENGYNYYYFEIDPMTNGSPEAYEAYKKLIENEKKVGFDLNYLCKPGDIYETESESVVYVREQNDVTFGDINDSSSVDLSDLTTLSQYILKDITLTEQQQKNADVNADGEVDISDLALLKQYVMNDDVKLGAVS